MSVLRRGRLPSVAAVAVAFYGLAAGNADAQLINDGNVPDLTATPPFEWSDPALPSDAVKSSYRVDPDLKFHVMLQARNLSPFVLPEVPPSNICFGRQLVRSVVSLDDVRSLDWRDPLAETSYLHDLLTRDLFEGLVRLGSDGRLERGVATTILRQDDDLDPDLVHWQLTIDPSNLWSDGRPVAAADFRRTFDRLASSGNPDPATLAVIDDLTLTLTTRRSDIYLFERLSRPSYVPTPDDARFDTGNDGHPFLIVDNMTKTNGAYQIASDSQGGTIELGPNPMRQDLAGSRHVLIAPMSDPEQARQSVQMGDAATAENLPSLLDPAQREVSAVLPQVCFARLSQGVQSDLRQKIYVGLENAKRRLARQGRRRADALFSETSLYVLSSVGGSPAPQDRMPFSGPSVILFAVPVTTSTQAIADSLKEDGFDVAIGDALQVALGAQDRPVIGLACVSAQDNLVEEYLDNALQGDDDATKDYRQALGMIAADRNIGRRHVALLRLEQKLKADGLFIPLYAPLRSMLLADLADQPASPSALPLSTPPASLGLPCQR